MLCNVVFRILSQDCCSDELNAGKQTTFLEDCLAGSLITCIPVGLVRYLYYSVFTFRNEFLRLSCRKTGKYHVKVCFRSVTGQAAFMKAFSKLFLQ